MPRKTYGREVQKRTKFLLDALLDFVENRDLEQYNQVKQVNFRWKDKNKLLVETKLRYLETLTKQYWEIREKKDNYPRELSKAQIYEAIKCLQYLKILNDDRIKTQGKEDWRFTLTLWSRDKQKNLKQFDIEWQERKPKKENTNSCKPNWADAPTVETFYACTKELDELKQWIVNDRCQLIAVMGIRGAGKISSSVKFGKGGTSKTDLSLKLAWDIEDEFEYVIWHCPDFEFEGEF